MVVQGHVRVWTRMGAGACAGARQLVLALGALGEDDDDGEQSDYAKTQQRLGGKAAGQREAGGGGGLEEHVRSQGEPADEVGGQKLCKRARSGVHGGGAQLEL